jgi:hypothetical protein
MRNDGVEITTSLSPKSGVNSQETLDAFYWTVCLGHIQQ